MVAPSTNRRPSMALDGEKLRQMRIAKGISQEKLALLCNVNKRTIQRAERGSPIALETAAFIAEAMQVSPTSLRSNQMELFEPANKAWNDVVLIPLASGRRVIDILHQSHDAYLTFEVEPLKDNLDPLAKLASVLEAFKPDPWKTPSDRYDPAYAELLERQAEVNDLLPTLSALGISVFVASYTAHRRIPRYDHYEGHMFLTERTPYEPVEVAIVVVSDQTASHLIRRPNDVYKLDDEIPF
jgi:transcriptional regulator with XRE-family HTH domain